MAVKSRIVAHYLAHEKSKTYRVEEAKVYPTKYSISDSTGVTFPIFSLGMVRKGSNPALGIILDDIFCCLFDCSAYVRDGVKFEHLAAAFDLKTLFGLELGKLEGWIKK